MVRPPLTPNGAAGLELCLSIFDGYDLDIGTKMLFVGMVQFNVVNAALGEKEEVMRNVELILDGIAARLP